MEDIHLLVETCSCAMFNDGARNFIIIFYITHVFSGIYYINASYYFLIITYILTTSYIFFAS